MGIFKLFKEKSKKERKMVKPATIFRENVSQSEEKIKTSFLQTNENLEDLLPAGLYYRNLGLHKQMKISRNDENEAKCQTYFSFVKKITLKYNLLSRKNSSNILCICSIWKNKINETNREEKMGGILGVYCYSHLQYL